MSDNKNTNEWIYKKIYYKNIPEGKYNICNPDCCGYGLIPIITSKNLIYYFDEDCEEYKDIMNFERKYNINIPNNIDGEELKLKYNSTWRYKFICEINNGYKEFFIEVPIDEKNNKKYPLYASCHIYNLIPYREYIITNFVRLKSEYGIIISDITYLSYYKDIDQYYTHKKNSKCSKYYINKKVIDILEKYFICENDKIYCVYNNKKEMAKLTLITEDKILTEDGSTKILQSLKLEIDNKKFIFYINNPNVINYKKEGKYCFLTMHIYNNSLYNNLIYGYEFKEDKYYYLKYEEKLILKYIDNNIANNFRMSKNQNLYTYLISNIGKKCGMIVNIDKDNNITHKLVNLNDKCFENILDISLLKPVKEWNNNDYYEINKFDDIIEGFDEDDEEDEEDDDEE